MKISLYYYDGVSLGSHHFYFCEVFMSELISGKEALIALANGDGVEVNKDGFKDWHLIDRGNYLEIFYNPDYKFRLKPRTITINGIEVPAPFEPESDCKCFVLSDSDVRGYVEYDHDKAVAKKHGFKVIGYWRTEEEIKQVVAALRQIFKP